MRGVLHWEAWLPVILFYVCGGAAFPLERALEPKAEEVLREMADLLTARVARKAGSSEF